MTTELIYNITMWLNAFPNKNGLSRKISSDGIILSKPKVDFNCIKLSFGAYAQVYESTTNTMKQRTVGAIALRPSNNHGSYYFMSLETGKRLNCYQVLLNHLFLSLRLLFPRGLFQHTLFFLTILVIMLVALAPSYTFPLFHFLHLPYSTLNLHHPIPILLLGYHQVSIPLTLVV